MSGMTWHTAKACDGEDMALTPAERAASAAKAENQATALEEEAILFMETATKQTLGEGGNEMVVLGAGLVGCLCAAVLSKKGFKVTMYERYPDIRGIPSVGRSINLSVTSRGLRAIRGLGGTFYDDMMTLATKVHGRIIHTQDGKTVFQRYGKDDSECNYSISRYELNKFLIQAAVDLGATINFDHALSETSDFTTEGDVGCILNFTSGHPSKPEELQRLQIDVKCPVIACDGAGSRARYAMRHAGLTSFTEDLLTRGYKEVLFPKPPEGSDFGSDGTNGGEPCSGRFGLHIWPRGDHMLMALANVDGSFTGTIYMDSKGAEDSFEALEGELATCHQFCEQYYGDALAHVGGMDALANQIRDNPNGLLGTVCVDTWAVKSKIVLLGDASHAMVPFFGQGCNCGFEDVLWLSKLLDKHCGTEDGTGVCAVDKCVPANLSACFQELQDMRKPNADAICEMALENFVEMRDKTADRKFQAMKRVENQLENRMTDSFRSRYAMVCYGGEGNVTYNNAYEMGPVIEKVLEELCAHMTSSEDGSGNIDTNEGLEAQIDLVDYDLAARLVAEHVAPQIASRGMDLTTIKH